MLPPGDQAPRPGQLTVMLSSTSLDLPDHRKAVIDAILRAECFPLAMEHGTAKSDSDAIRFSLGLVDRADVYLGIFGHRYGHISEAAVNPKGWSVTEHEYRRAVERGIPALIFVMHDDHPVTRKDIDLDPVKVARLEALKAELQKGICAFFTSPQELHSRAYQAIMEEKQKQGRAPAAAPPARVDGTLIGGALRRACREQVAAEITTRVGKKYIRQLFRQRPLERDLHEFLTADLDRHCTNDLLTVLRLLTKQCSSEITAAALRDLTETIAPLKDYHETLRQARQAVATLPDPSGQQLAAALDRLPQFRPSCFLVKDRAGSGKTNLLCRMAESDPDGSYCLLLTCKALPWSLTGLEQLLGQTIKRNWPEDEPNEAVQHLARHSDQELLLAIVRWLRDNGQQLVVFLDGINENRELDKLQDLLLRAFENLRRYPVKFVVTCRDIFWSFFDAERWDPFLYQRRAFELPGFVPEEMNGVIAAYFNHFEITGQVIGRAREQCQFPLLLRFFCEAYRGKDIRQYDDLRLKDLFQKYWDRKKTEIADSLALTRQGSQRVESFLYRLGEHMLRQAATRLPVRAIPEITGERDLDSPASLYQRFLDEDIILEELPPDSAFDTSHAARRITFVYDEFYDYVMALAHVQKKGWDGKGLRDICLDFCDVLRQARSFEQLRGVAEYLVLLAEPRNYHRELCAVLARTGQHEVLSSVLPKLRGEMAWAVDVLGCCLKTVEDLHMKGTRKKSKNDELPDPFRSLSDLLQLRQDDSSLFGTLVQESPE